MKNFTLSFFITFLVFSGLSAQEYTTGIISLPLDSGNDYSGKIDVTSTIVTLTLIGPSSGWLGIGFNATGMGSIGMDCVIFDGTNMSDRRFNGIGVEPPLDVTQNWTVSSNTVNAGVRTVVATRARNTGDANDYIFPAAAQPINIAYARRIGSFGIAYHGAGSCSSTTVNLTLGADDFLVDSFKMYPNPTKGYLTFELPVQINSGDVKIYDNLGRVVRNQTITAAENSIETATLTTGSYIVVLRTEYGNATKTLLID